MLLDTPLCDFGWNAPAFSLKDFDGNDHAMADSMGANGLLIAFICNHCPYVQAIADRLVDDANVLLTEGIGVLGIMSNDYRSVPADGPDNMKKFAAKHHFPFPYLVDEDQSVAQSYGAVCTPDFFGFNRNAELQYRGRLDDAKFSSQENRSRELVDAMGLIAKTNHGPQEQTPSMGCSIKWR